MTGELFTEEQVRRPALRYHGGKFREALFIKANFPANFRVYCEVFGGAAGVLLQMPRSKGTRKRIEIYNDLDEQVVNFWRVLRDPEQRRRLAEAVDLTPYSRTEFIASYEPSNDPVEAARRFVTRCYFGHGCCSMDPEDSNGFRSCDIRAGKSYAREWTGIPAAIMVAGNRFTGVTIENLDFRRLMPKFDSPDTFFYLDPPYLMETRDTGGKGYVHEMSTHDHEQLAHFAKSMKGMVAISGYHSSLYDRLYDGWRRVEKRVRANGQKGAVQRTEVLWMNYPATTTTPCTPPSSTTSTPSPTRSTKPLEASACNSPKCDITSELPMLCP
jgi:DNA adenine methylase